MWSSWNVILPADCFRLPRIVRKHWKGRGGEPTPIEYPRHLTTSRDKSKWEKLVMQIPSDSCTPVIPSGFRKVFGPWTCNIIQNSRGGIHPQVNQIRSLTWRVQNVCYWEQKGCHSRVAQWSISHHFTLPQPHCKAEGSTGAPSGSSMFFLYCNGNVLMFAVLQAAMPPRQQVRRPVQRLWWILLCLCTWGC